MLNISKYLEKFVKKLQSESFSNNQILEIINNITSVSLKLEELELKNNIIYIKSSPAVKNKLFIYKEDILKEINLFSKIKIIDIR